MERHHSKKVDAPSGTALHAGRAPARRRPALPAGAVSADRQGTAAEARERSGDRHLLGPGRRHCRRPRGASSPGGTSSLSCATPP
ncbi:MAG: hypothetical protein ACLRWQ_11995 [Flavonifractor plautii]